MAILSFWSNSKKETGQTLSLVAIATHMSVEHNYKTLIIDATLDDDTIPRCFWNLEANNNLKKELNKGKMDIASGAEGLVSAIASNKVTPEIISNYTKVVFKNRLDILLGLKTKNITDHEKSLSLYTDLITAANKYYDLVIVDLPKTRSRKSVCDILKMSDVIVYTLSQNLKQINEYVDSRDKVEELAKKHIIPLVCQANSFCKYNIKNISLSIKDKTLEQVIYNNVFREASNEAGVAQFFLNIRINKKAWDRNSQFLESVASVSRIYYKRI